MEYGVLWCDFNFNMFNWSVTNWIRIYCKQYMYQFKKISIKSLYIKKEREIL